ncbi:hypothetical protein BO78DRAFT_390261 [Aspergillus sclerotiicarbonarius CBS 121057]|uniref:DNA2/NAM7 helicase helicase domain-containing protein n=1 Tax=Aspergillus sclerotiicarbonarius (strain CBS 121057 / IBT 28362) TaxID=1448318 RepID=A0A319DX63_ASPSB|nr:hypothetical protein BO78DRAFT_390261 [Aspergillus sclerotiicarbonarius CBS 121057]
MGFCDPVQGRWHKILLNQHAGARHITDPFSGVDFDSDQVQAVINTLLNIPGITWTAGQQRVIESLREFPERLLLIQGFPGTGTTLNLMGIADVCRLLGIHVLYATPTHFEGDATCDTADKFMQLSEGHLAKSYGVPSKHLEGHVIRLAMNEERTLIASYPPEEQIAKSKGDLYDLIDDDFMDPEGEEVDMLAEIRRFTSMLQEKSFRQFSDEDKRKTLLTFK